MGLGSGIRNPRSGIQKKMYAGSRIRIHGQKGTGYRNRIRNTDSYKFFVKTVKIYWKHRKKRKNIYFVLILSFKIYIYRIQNSTYHCD